MRIQKSDTAPKYHTAIAGLYKEEQFKSLFFQLVALIIALLLYAKTGHFLFLIGLAYCVSSAFFLLTLILITLLRPRVAKIVAIAPIPSVFTPVAPKPVTPVKTVENEKTEVNFQQSLRKKSKIVNPPSKLTIVKYKEYKEKFHLSKDLEREFKQWVHNKIIVTTASTGVYAAKPFTRTEMADIALIANNGFICYDKNNESQNKMLFKAMYNYFNTIVPGSSSYYSNPMDEFIFDDTSKMKISGFGLLVEDTESLLEGKKMFNVYFMDKNVLYDTEGDVLLSFLLLLIYANEYTGRYLGALSLRNMKFLAGASG
ncbi:hypothetical protein NEDG_01505 [Nematocida displodere]|uniref:Uncharacterized protein n=1 Tax=Nematocida displodere TaxID=1805483 RepID=A0A177EDR8_9MICR|nr:hypothetical protein NEDG_01505 [Nematocida displodere]